MAGLVDVTPATITIGVAVFFLGSRIIQTLYAAFTSPLRHIPGPWIARLSNVELKRNILRGKRIFYLHDLHLRYGSVVRISPHEISVSDKEGFSKIHSIRSDFVKNDWYEKLTTFPRLSVFTMRDKAQHAARRRVFAKGFSKSYLKEHWESVIADKARTAVEKIKWEASNGDADLMKWWTFMAFDAVGHLGFGESFGMLERGEILLENRLHPRARQAPLGITPLLFELLTNEMSLESALIGNGVGAELPWVRTICRHLPFKAMKRTFDASAYILDYGRKAVDNAKRQNNDGNLMTSIMRESEAESKGTKIDELDVCIESTNLIFAGSGTTANTLVYLSWAVMMRPKLQAALEDEVAALKQDFTDDDLEALPLLNATIQETLRLYASVPGSLPRVVPPGGTNIAGYFIPEGTTVSTQAYTMHRDPSIYREPESFDPGRWFSPEQHKRSRSTWCPFGAGAYSCLGIHMASMEIRYATAMFFRECRGARLSPSTTEKSMAEENYFVIKPKGNRCDITLNG